MKGERNRQSMRKQITEKLKEALASVLPVTAIVLLLQFFFPIPKYMLISFIIGAVLLIIGMALFTLGADTAMMPMGERMGCGSITNTAFPAKNDCSSSLYLQLRIHLPPPICTNDS